jgi:MFS family permease
LTDGAAGSPGLEQPDPFRRIVWSLAGAETIIWAGLFYSFPALLLAWERDLGWSKTELAGAFTLALIVSAFMAPVVGRLIDQGFGRLIFVSSALGGALLLVALSTVTQMWQFYAVWFLIGLMMAGALYEPCFAILTRSMGTRARRAITVVTLIAGFAGTVSFPSAHLLVSLGGWRIAVIVFAIVIAVFAVPLVWFGCTCAAKHGRLHAPRTSPRSIDVLPLLRTPTFWLLAVGFAAIALNHAALITHLLPLLDERGAHPQTAVLVASMMGPMQVAGRLAMLAAEKHVSVMGITVACFVCTMLAALALLGATSVPLLLVVFVLLQGAGYGVTSIVRPVVTAQLLGRDNFGVVSGLLAVPFLGAGALAPTLAALIWGIGGYDLVIWLVAGSTLLGLTSFLSAVAANRVARRGAQ